MEGNIFEQRTDLTELSTAISNIRSEIAKIIVGQEEMVNLLLAALLADGHVLIEGVPGVAKTLTAKLLARVVSVDYKRIQFTPDLMPSDVLGTLVYNQGNSEFNFKKGPVFTNILLIDEINRAPAKTQAALFEVMEERQVTMDGETHKMSEPFMVLATQNPIEQEGTYRLPEAQLDRFLFKIRVGYPKADDEFSIVEQFHQRKGINDIGAVAPILSAEQLHRYRTLVKGLHIDQNLIRYISQVVCNTRENASLFLGASPRASLSILNASKAIAALRGRDFVTPEDIKETAPSVLNHRISLTPEKEMEGISTMDVVQQILKNIEVPR